MSDALGFETLHSLVLALHILPPNHYTIATVWLLFFHQIATHEHDGWQIHKFFEHLILPKNIFIRRFCAN
jgi:hypothetical protein